MTVRASATETPPATPTDVDACLATVNPCEALAMASADVIGRQRSDGREGLSELLELVLEIRDWRVLEARALPSPRLPGCC
ncbi:MULTISPECIES: hypothetical protein [unclassified Brevibacterium]|uniref:hypothetical protein n=1 Tax=unclassified Brevibacterium TaxID=2614124 RepID=UPI0010922A79|nr:hypothetical protein [Brevibacterium sp. S22]TGD31036.1 hypothetical protein EB835_10540 [Brevibacterium sp. S22]